MGVKRALVAALLVAAARAGDSDESYESYSSSSPTNSSSSSTNNSTSSNTSTSASSGSQHRWTDAYPCKYYPADEQGCTRPRSCFDCLNTPVSGDNVRLA